MSFDPEYILETENSRHTIRVMNRHPFINYENKWYKLVGYAEKEGELLLDTDRLVRDLTHGSVIGRAVFFAMTPEQEDILMKYHGQLSNTMLFRHTGKVKKVFTLTAVAA